MRTIAALSVLAGLAASTVQAQSDVTTIATDIATVLADFQAQGLIPKPVDDSWLNLTSALTLKFGDTNATTGQSYTLPADTSALASAPTYQLTVPSQDASYYEGQSFTAMFVDPGAAGYTQSGTNVTRHYLANDLKYSNGALTNSTPAITSYNEPGPAAGSGAHRYLALVFDQGTSFQAPAGLNQAGTPLSNMTLASYVKQSNMGKLVAMNFILVENNSAGSTTFSTTSAPASTSVNALASSIASSISGGSATSAASAAGSSTAATSGASAILVGVPTGLKLASALAGVAIVTMGMVFA